MTNRPKSEADYLVLIERVKQVFADVPYPGDDNIISTPEHVAECDECGGLHKALVGWRWAELIEDESVSGHVSHAMSFFSPAGWQYYLPAYLIQNIREHQFSSLYFQPSTEPEIRDYHAERINRLTVNQCKVIIAYLLVVLEEDSDSEYMYERNKAAVEHWQDNYRRIIARNSDTG